MSYEPKEGDFSLFKNDKKTDANQPDYTGRIFINGKSMRLAAWIKQGEKGKFFSGKVSEFQAKNELFGKAEELTAPEPQDDLPF